jgi:hypothetical protein
MTKVCFLALWVAPTFLFGQSKPTISAIDFVQILNGRQKEAVFYYENNWKAYRDVALQKGYIKSYKLLITNPDSVANFDLILITEYRDSTQAALSENRFQQIIKDTRPTGSKLLNEWQPKDFRKNVFFKQGKTIFDTGQK